MHGARVAAVLLAGLLAIAALHCADLSGFSGGAVPREAGSETGPSSPGDGPGDGGSSSPVDGGDAGDGPGDASLDGPAAISFMQANAALGQNSVKTAVPFINEVKPHSSVIVVLDLTQEASQTLVSVTDSIGSTYTTLSGPHVASFSGTAYAFYLAAAFDVTGGPSVIVTATLSATTSGTEVFAHEYTGVGSFGVAAFNSGNQAAATGDGMTAGPLATTTAGELLFAYGASNMTTPGSQFAPRFTFDDNVTEDRLAPTAGNYTVTATKVGTGSWALFAGTFLPGVTR